MGHEDVVAAVKKGHRQRIPGQDIAWIVRGLVAADAITEIGAKVKTGSQDFVVWPLTIDSRACISTR